MLGSALGLRPPLFCSFFSFPFIIKSILISNKTPTSEGVSKPPARASGFEARNGFRVPQNITCSVRVNRKSALRVGLDKAEKNGFEPFHPLMLYPINFSIHLLHLSPYKVRVAFAKYCPIAPDQILPTNAPNYRIKRVHWNNLLLCAISHASLFAGIRSRWQL